MQDLIQQDFTADSPNTKYVGDITDLPVSGAKSLHCATVIDLCYRRLAGWAIADHMRAELVIDALAAAEEPRGSLDGAIFPCGHGSPYTSAAFAEACRSAGVERSMSAVGSSADNAAAESFNTVPQTRGVQGREGMADSPPGPTRHLPMGRPLQQTPPLPPRTTQPDRLRTTP